MDPDIQILGPPRSGTNAIQGLVETAWPQATVTGTGKHRPPLEARHDQGYVEIVKDPWAYPVSRARWHAHHIGIDASTLLSSWPWTRQEVHDWASYHLYIHEAVTPYHDHARVTHRGLLEDADVVAAKIQHELGLHNPEPATTSEDRADGMPWTFNKEAYLTLAYLDTLHDAGVLKQLNRLLNSDWGQGVRDRLGLQPPKPPENERA